MSARRTRFLGAASCLMAAVSGAILIGLGIAREPHLGLIFLFFGLGVLGLLLGTAGLLSSRGQGRISYLSILGLVLNLAPALVGLALVGVIFGQRH